jgi:hypothetical protein
MFFEHPAFSASVRFILLCHPVNQYVIGVGWGVREAEIYGNKICVNKKYA